MADPSSTPTPITSIIDTKSFMVLGNATATCHTGRRVKIKRTGLSSIHGTIGSPSSFNGASTTVTLTEDSDALDANCIGLWVAQMSGPGGYSSLPVHPHEDENSGGDRTIVSGGTWA